MKTLNLCLIASFLWLFPLRGMACAYEPYTPHNTYIYRLFTTDAPYANFLSFSTPDRYCLYPYGIAQSFDFKQENLTLWRRQTGTRVSDQVLEALVYSDDEGGTADLRGSDLGDEACAYLELAKSIAKVRAEMADPWYYPASHNDGQCLEEDLKECQQYDGRVLKSRYALQILRCLNAMHSYEEAHDYWVGVRDSLLNDALLSMVDREAAAALYKTGRVAEAKEIYARVGDIQSLNLCLDKDEDEMEYVFDRNPNSPFFAERIQSNLFAYSNAKNTTDEWVEMPQGTEKFLALCRRAMNDKRVEDKALWTYAAAATCDALGREQEALRLVGQGEACCRDKEFQKSFRVLRIFVEAQTSPLTSAYENRLASDLTWLADVADGELPDTKREELLNLDNYDWAANSYYWNDAMRRVVLEVLCPRYAKAGNMQRVLQLANYADNRMFLHLDKPRRSATYYADFAWNAMDYSNALYDYVDATALDDLRAYVSKTMNADRSVLGALLNRGSYRDAEYWADMMGTHCLRGRQYAEAATWLARVSVGFQHQLNLWQGADYLRRNPFLVDIYGYSSHKDRLLPSADNYRLDFARRMAGYEKAMKTEKTAQKRAEAMFMLGIGMQNQAANCWALTDYGDHSYSTKLDQGDVDWAREYDTTLFYAESLKSLQLGRSYVERALVAMPDKERKATLLHQMVRNRDIMDQCADTKMVQYLRAHCDTWRDYKPRHRG